MKNQHSRPSKVWEDWLEDLVFLREIPNQRLRRHVGHGYLIAAPIEKDFWSAAAFRRDLASGESQVQQFDELTVEVPERLWLSEPDPSRAQYSIPVQRGGNTFWLNADTFRTQVDLSNLHHLGLLESSTSFVEVGGGYGRLAHAVLTSSNVSVSYAVIDFPEILEIVHRWISYVEPEIPIYSHASGFSLQANDRNGLHLIPNSNEKARIESEVLINVNSFFEMRSSQVHHYLNSICVGVPLVYSHNRDRQPDNHELDTTIRGTLGQYGQLHSWSAASRKGDLPSESDKWLSVLARYGSSWRPPENVANQLILPATVQMAL